MSKILDQDRDQEASIQAMESKITSNIAPGDQIMDDDWMFGTKMQFVYQLMLMLVEAELTPVWVLSDRSRNQPSLCRLIQRVDTFGSPTSTHSPTRILV